MSNELDLLLQECRYYVQSNEIDSALNSLLEWLGDVASDHRLAGRVFASKDLDSLCLDIGSAALQQRARRGNDNPDSIDVLFIASNLYRTGGHTALIEDYVRALGPHRCRILLTDHRNAADRALIRTRITPLTSDLRFSPKPGTPMDKLNWLLGELDNAKAQYALFVHHPDDPIAVAAMQRVLCSRLAFVHHADHTFMLGATVDVDAHIDFRESGAKNCSQHLGIRHNTVVPLASIDYGAPDQDSRFLNSGLVTCTSGNNKFEFPYAVQLSDCIPRVIEASGGCHLHIGQLSAPTLAELRDNLRERRIPEERVRIIPWVENLWKTLIDEGVDYYIDSFPLPGCRALVEAMGCGLPVALHQNYTHELFSNKTFAYDNAFVWSSVEDLCCHVKRLNREKLHTESKEARDFFLGHHTLDKLETSLKRALGDAGSMSSKGAISQASTEASAYDSLRSFLDCFRSVNIRSDSHAGIQLKRLGAFIEQMTLSDDVITAKLTSELSPTTMKAYQKSYAEISRNEQLVNLLNETYLVVSNGELHKERFSRVLFACSMLDKQDEPAISRKHRVLKQMKSFYRSLREGG